MYLYRTPARPAGPALFLGASPLGHALCAPSAAAPRFGGLVNTPHNTRLERLYAAMSFKYYQLDDVEVGDESVSLGLTSPLEVSVADERATLNEALTDASVLAACATAGEDAQPQACYNFFVLLQPASGAFTAQASVVYRDDSVCLIETTAVDREQTPLACGIWMFKFDPVLAPSPITARITQDLFLN